MVEFGRGHFFFSRRLGSKGRTKILEGLAAGGESGTFKYYKVPSLSRPKSFKIVRFTMTCVWAEAQMDLGRPCSIANIVRFTMTCVWAAAQMHLGRPCSIANILSSTFYTDLCVGRGPNGFGPAMKACGSIHDKIPICIRGHTGQLVSYSS